jgi:putative ABC transport system permease protein
MRSLPDDGILVGSAIHDRLGVAVGDAIDIVFPATSRTVHERIAGFVDEPMGTFAYVALPRLAADLDVSEDTLLNGIAVTYAGNADATAMRDRLTASGDVAAYVDTKGVAHVVDRFMGLFYAFVGIMLVLGGIMAFALIFTTMTVNVSERTTEIATLRANGMTWGGVSRLLASENLLLTLLGLVPGLLFGYAAAWSFMRTFSSDLFRFDLVVRPTTFLFIAAAVVAVALISQVPALRVVRSIDVASELRTLSA